MYSDLVVWLPVRIVYADSGPGPVTRRIEGGFTHCELHVHPERGMCSPCAPCQNAIPSLLEDIALRTVWGYRKIRKLPTVSMTKHGKAPDRRGRFDTSYRGKAKVK